MQDKIKKVAVICCYNREDILEAMLETGLKEQIGVEIEKKFYYNKFKSAAETYNYAIKETNAEYLVFVHQDIMFLETDFLQKVVDAIDRDKEALYGLCGTGSIDAKTCTYSNVYHGLWNKNVGTSLADVKAVEGLDEIFLACHRDVFNVLKFDDKIFDGWHLYVEDICLQAKLNDKKVFVLPLKAQHKNSLEMPKYMMIYGTLPSDYFVYLRAIRNKYKKNVDIIACPCITIKLSFFSFYRALTKKRINSAYRSFLRKLSMK